jgi:putative SOS response-associated peptidase YedK
VGEARKRQEAPGARGDEERRPVRLAGLWSRWRPRGGGEPVETCTIVTTEANELLQRIHDRMPVILAREDYDRWLDVGAEPDPADLMRPYPSEAMIAYPRCRHGVSVRSIPS